MSSRANPSNLSIAAELNTKAPAPVEAAAGERRIHVGQRRSREDKLVWAARCGSHCCDRTSSSPLWTGGNRPELQPDGLHGRWQRKKGQTAACLVFAIPMGQHVSPTSRRMATS
jgi:hypothetical protein